MKGDQLGAIGRENKKKGVLRNKGKGGARALDALSSRRRRVHSVQSPQQQQAFEALMG